MLLKNDKQCSLVTLLKHHWINAFSEPFRENTALRTPSRGSKAKFKQYTIKKEDIIGFCKRRQNIPEGFSGLLVYSFPASPVRV